MDIIKANETALNIDVQLLRKTELVLRAINHKLRQEILHLIHKEQNITVTDLYIRLRLDQSTTSQHLALLRRVGAVCTTRDGKNIYYSVDYDRINEIVSLTDNISSAFE